MSQSFTVKPFFVPGLAHASYLVGSGHEAVVVDPKRDVDGYIDAAQELGLRIVGVLETHPHADFVSGHLELSERTGAPIYVSHLAPARYERKALHDGDSIRVGDVELIAMETPGHSPDSMTFVLREDGRPRVAFTGDTLFAGDVGRPDLRDAEEQPAQLAAALYNSLFERLMKLPGDVEIYPAHRAGSLCGRQISQEPSSTIGAQRSTNWALQIQDREQFVRAMVSNLPDRPLYFAHAVRLNLSGAPALSDLARPVSLESAALRKAVTRGAVVVDTRDAERFGQAHFPGSLNIGIGSPMFSTWVGFLVDFDSRLVLVVETDADSLRAQLELARIGYDHIDGFALASDLGATATLAQQSVCDLKLALGQGAAPRVLDVRTPAEWTQSHINGAIHIPLPRLISRLSELPRDEPLAVVCGSGYRSSIASSLLAARGFHVQNVVGGMAAFENSQCSDWQPSDLVFAGKASKGGTQP